MVIFRNMIFPLLFLLTFFLFSDEVSALPAFARQTGMPCSVWHMQAFGPGLTPFGRNFKLYGYTDKSGESKQLIPLSAMIRGSFTHTQRGQPDGAAAHFGPNNNATIDEAAIFYAGRVTSKVGAFVEATYDGVEKKVLLDNTDIRFADYVDLAGKRYVYGVSLNNSPTVSDLWNTTPVWSFPWSSSPWRLPNQRARLLSPSVVRSAVPPPI
jgi:hypothetical protein